MSRLHDAWQELPPSTRLVTLGGVAQSGLPQLIDEIRESIELQLAQLMMPGDQDYASLLRFQENYKDLRRELDLLTDLRDMIEEATRLMRERSA